jgi:hypothetical protein
MPFQVIFEYRLAASSCDDVKQWVQRWTDLAKLDRGSDEYNQKLAEITEDIIVNNKGALAQIRTNEIALAPGPPGTTKHWEMREFALTGSGTSLALTERLVHRTPPDSLNNTEALAQLINSKEDDILDGTYDIGGNEGANPQLDEDTYWRGDPAAAEQIKNPLARFIFSQNTCSGCHARETCTKFSQVVPQGPGKEACLSSFLAGGHNVPDPLLCTTVLEGRGVSAVAGGYPRPRSYRNYHYDAVDSSTVATPTIAPPQRGYHYRRLLRHR